MLARDRLTTTVKAAAIMLALLLSSTACRNTSPEEPALSPSPKVKYSQNHDVQIREIMDMARQGRWDDAQAKADALYAVDPKDPIVDRVHTWTAQQAQQMREQKVEDSIRDVNAKSSVFSPSLKDLVTEKKDRGLPARKDVRDVIDRVESAPYIPDSYGKVVHEKGPLFDFESAKGRMSKVLEKEVSIHLDNVPLEAVLLNISQTAGVNIVADKALPALKQTLSVNLDKVRLGEFFRYAGRNYDLQFQVGDELVWVVDGKDPKKLMEETRFYRLRKGFVLPAQFGNKEAVKTTTTVNNVQTVQEVQKFDKFVNDEAPLTPSLEKAITNLWTGSRCIIDYERNLVVAKGTPEQLDVLEQIIKEFDTPIQQVLIEARFVTLTKPAFMQLGVLWETGRPTGAVRTPTDYTGLITSQNIQNVGVGLEETFTNILNRETLSMTISALEQTGESQTLSAPRLTVLNNRPATIADGKVQYYYEEYTVKQTVQQYYTTSSFVPSGKPTKITAGAELNVLASISGDGNSIVLALNPRVNTDVQLVKYTTLVDYDQNGNLQNSMDIRLPQYRTQELATRVTVKSGETVVMGGVLERQRSTYVESVPVLGDLPIIGVLFRRRTEQDIPRYLLIFVTATIVKDTGEYLVYEDTAAGTGNGKTVSNAKKAPSAGTVVPAGMNTNAVPVPAPAPAPAPATTPAQPLPVGPGTNQVAPVK